MVVLDSLSTLTLNMYFTNHLVFFFLIAFMHFADIFDIVWFYQYLYV